MLTPLLKQGQDIVKINRVLVIEQYPISSFTNSHLCCFVLVRLSVFAGCYDLLRSGLPTFVVMLIAPSTLIAARLPILCYFPGFNTAK